MNEETKKMAPPSENQASSTENTSKSLQQCQSDFQVMTVLTPWIRQKAILKMIQWIITLNSTELTGISIVVLLCTRQWISSSVNGWLIIPSWPPNPRSKTKRKDAIDSQMYCRFNPKNKHTHSVSKTKRVYKQISHFINCVKWLIHPFAKIGHNKQTVVSYRDL